eukprot:7346806-Lingulodinium_polyedra.AAC.1
MASSAASSVCLPSTPHSAWNSISAASAMACASIGRRRAQLPSGLSKASLSWRTSWRRAQATSLVVAWPPSPSP